MYPWKFRKEKKFLVEIVKTKLFPIIKSDNNKKSLNKLRREVHEMVQISNTPASGSTMTSSYVSPAQTIKSQKNDDDQSQQINSATNAINAASTSELNNAQTTSNTVE
jgi:hypothetical protein